MGVPIGLSSQIDDTRWVLPHGIQLNVDSVIDMNQNLDKNDVVAHVILSNTDTKGPNGAENKKKLKDIINVRKFFYEIQHEIALKKLSLIHYEKITEFPSTAKIVDTILPHYFKKDNDESIKQLNQFIRESKS